MSLIGDAPSFARVLDRLRLVAASDATVLVEGDTGTGKELVARRIHELSSRRPHLFCAVNCGAIPDSLVEDELFGHARGAFTDARDDRVGLLATADKGTFCLDEVGSLSARGQQVLLRVLEDRVLRRVGSTAEHRINVRFIALTNTPLWDLVKQGRFRADVYYRLCVLSIVLPPLRERLSDVLPLARHFLQKHARTDQPVTIISPDAERRLMDFDWPGNVRQLEHTILRAAQLAATPIVEAGDIELPDLSEPSERGQTAHLHRDSFTALKRQAVEAFERRYLTGLMQQCRGNITHAARLAHKDRRDLSKLLKKYHIMPRTFAGA
ncbi:MAG: sigma-54 dependent transcriptional regulator [Acidobacteriota bacterium]